MKKFQKIIDKTFLETYKLNVGDVFKLVRKDKPECNPLVFQIVNNGDQISFVLLDGGVAPHILDQGLDATNLPKLFDDHCVVTVKKVPLLVRKCFDGCKNCPIKCLCINYKNQKKELKTIFDNFKATDEEFKKQGRYDYTLFSILKSRLEQEVWDKD